MRKLLSTAALVFGLTAASTADAGAGRWGEELRFVANTTIASPTGSGNVALCHLVDFADAAETLF